MGVYIDKSKIAFGKKTYKCPCCGEMKYNKFEYDGVEMDNDKYGHCWNSNGNCFPYKSRICGTMAYPSDVEIRSYYYGESAQKTITYAPKQVKAVYSFSFADKKYLANDDAMQTPLFRYIQSICLNVADSVKKYGVTAYVDDYAKSACYKMQKVVFWLTDINGMTCDGKEMCYDATGHRVKLDNSISWASKRTAYYNATRQKYTTNTGNELKNFMQEFENKYEFRRPLFGENLLANQQGEPVLLFESEKTAVIMDAYCRMAGKKAICLGLGGKNYFTADRLKQLKGRNVTYLPDSDTLKVVFNEDGNQEREIDVMYRKLKAQDAELANSIKLGDACWVPSTKFDSILRVKKHEVDAILQEKGAETIEEAKLDFADIVCWRFEHRKSPIEDLPFGNDEPKEYINPFASNKDYAQLMATPLLEDDGTAW